MDFDLVLLPVFYYKRFLVAYLIFQKWRKIKWDVVRIVIVAAITRRSPIKHPLPHQLLVVPVVLSKAVLREEILVLRR